MQTSRFYSHGKLLLTGEYAVLDGAKAIALPCKLGQSLVVKKNSSDFYTWTSYLNSGKVWQKLNFSPDDILKNKSKTAFEKRLFQVLRTVYKLSPNTFDNTYDFTTRLDFEKDWGLGSSSTLINNLSKWAKIDPYELLDLTFGGSGYDIAAGSMQSPFVYQRRDAKVYIEAIKLSDSITSHLFFIYLNQKQNSRQAIANYRKVTPGDHENLIRQIDEITLNIIKSDNLNTFERLLESHENCISKLIGVETIKNQKFKDYKAGILKSLGAWGGDFIMATAKDKNDLDYFTQKGYKTIFQYNELTLRGENLM